MTAPCFYCGTALSCGHREVEPPRTPPTDENMKSFAQPLGFANRRQGVNKYR